MDSQSEAATSRLALPVPFAVLAAYLSRTVYLEYVNPLEDIPVPWLARYTRFWLWRQSYHETGIGSSRRYIVDTVSLGVAPRPTVTESNVGPIAPNEYSLDGPEAAKVIFRTRNHLEKVNR